MGGGLNAAVAVGAGFRAGAGAGAFMGAEADDASVVPSAVVRFVAAISTPHGSGVFGLLGGRLRGAVTVDESSRPSDPGAMVDEDDGAFRGGEAPPPLLLSRTKSPPLTASALDFDMDPSVVSDPNFAVFARALASRSASVSARVVLDESNNPLVEAEGAPAMPNEGRRDPPGEEADKDWLNPADD